MMFVAPSILSADFSSLKDEIKTVENEIQYLHIDVMDGHFVPNITIGAPVVKMLRPHFPNLVFDTHLMISHPLQYAKDFKDAGCDILTFHLESSDDPNEVISLIKKMEMKVGISIKPATNVEALIPYLSLVDLVLIMSVEPGFGGQKFMDRALNKISFLKEYKEKNNLNYLIEVDGGIDNETALLVKNAGCEIVVSGSYIFKNVDRKNAIKSIM